MWHFLIISKTPAGRINTGGNGGPCWIRTSDQLVKSQIVYLVISYIFQSVENLFCLIGDIWQHLCSPVMARGDLIELDKFLPLFNPCGGNE